MNYEQFTIEQQNAIEKFRKMIVNKTDKDFCQMFNHQMFNMDYHPYKPLLVCIGYFVAHGFDAYRARQMARFCSEKNWFFI